MPRTDPCGATPSPPLSRSHLGEELISGATIALLLENKKNKNKDWLGVVYNAA